MNLTMVLVRESVDPDPYDIHLQVKRLCLWKALGSVLSCVPSRTPPGALDGIRRSCSHS